MIDWTVPRKPLSFRTSANNKVGREVLSEEYPIMLIDITGYVTAELSSYSFAIKVTSDKVEPLKCQR